ncbi:MAG: hypothetical protein H7096_14050 [Flavobacterium sp.]|nr:hypothetical protein [Pedobacter sp.]
MVDHDGSIVYSHIVYKRLADDKNQGINPAKSEVTVSYAAVSGNGR